MPTSRRGGRPLAESARQARIMAKKAVFVPPQQDLRRKAVNFKKGFTLKLAPEELRRLEAVVEKATDDFTREVADKLRQLRTAIAAAAESSGEPAAAIQSIRALQLDIKGMGGMFNYPLLTAYAKSLNDFVVLMTAPNPNQQTRRPSCREREC